MTIRSWSKHNLHRKYQNHRYLQGHKVRKGSVVWAKIVDKDGNVVWEGEVQA